MLAAVVQLQLDYAAIVVSDEDSPATHQQVSIATQRQQRDTVIIYPDAPAIDDIEAEYTPIDAANHYDPVRRFGWDQYL